MGKRKSTLESVGIMAGTLIKKIKDFFKAFYPIPTKSFMREMNRSNDMMLSSCRDIQKAVSEHSFQRQKLECIIEKQNGELIKLSGICMSQSNRISELSAYLEAQNSLVQSLSKQIFLLQDEAVKLTSMYDRIHEEFTHTANVIVGRMNPSSKAIFYTSELERKFYKNTFNVEVFESEDFPGRVKKLFEGLDQKSISTAARALTRLKKIVSFDKEKMSLDIYTAEEQEFLNTDFRDFNLSILTLSDSLFVWNGYYLPIRHFEYCVFGDLHGIRNFQCLDKIRDRSIMDIGAFIGDSALVFSSFTDKKIYSFEASPKNYEQLLKTIELNHKTNIVPLNMALGSEKDSTCIFHLAEEISCSSINENDGFHYTETYEVKTTTLDDFVEKNEIEVGLIKVDIEGAEQDFLKGALRTITRQRPALIISIYHNSDDFFGIKPMLEELRLGYTFKIHRPLISTIFTETVLLAEVVKQ